LEDEGSQFVAYAVAIPLGKDELLYIYPGLDYTKHDGRVFKENLEKHVRTFPVASANGR
jgi:hypothetical protein